MNKLEEFKTFVRKHPILIEHVQKDEMTWQKFYEIYELYGEDTSAWNSYIKNEEQPKTTNTSSDDLRGGTSGWSDIINIAKNIDVDKVQNGITSLQKALGLVSDLFVKDSKTTTSSYKPRPLYRSFED